MSTPKKKDFTEEDAVMQFINVPAEEGSTQADNTPVKEIVKVVYIEGRETKSRRVQLLLKPSVYNKAKARAEHYGISLNDYINQVLEKVED